MRNKMREIMIAYTLGWDGGTTPNAHEFLKQEIAQLESRAMQAEADKEKTSVMIGISASELAEALRKILTHLEQDGNDRGFSTPVLEAKRIAETALSSTTSTSVP